MQSMNESRNNKGIRRTNRRTRRHPLPSLSLHIIKRDPYILTDSSNSSISRRRKERVIAMMEANIEENEMDQHEEAAQLEQQQVAAAETKQRHLTISSVLERKEKFPLRNRKKIDVLIEEFLRELGNDIDDMLYENELDDADNYDGLDSDRDTEEEVETAIRFFPEVLTRSIKDDEGHLHYPIQGLAIARDEDGMWQCNVRTVSFIPIVARVAVEFGLFEEDERGGLLSIDDESCNVLHHLMACDPIKLENREQHHEAVDDKYLQVLIKLRQLDLLKKKDIQSYDLLHRLCHNDYIPEKRYKMLVEWDPNALTQNYRFGQLPLNEAIVGSIKGFQFVFEYGIRYFPKKKGISLLFRKMNFGRTAFQHACRNFGDQKVMKVVEDTLACYSGTPVNVPEALLSAAIDENVHLDCVYFLLRREPDLLLKLLPQLLPSSLSSPASVTGSPNDNDDDNKSRNSSKRENVEQQHQLQRLRPRLDELFRYQFKRMIDWLVKIIFAASIGFQVPVRSFGDTTVISRGFLLALALTRKLAVRLLTPIFFDVDNSNDNKNDNDNSSVSPATTSIPSKRFRGKHLRDCFVVGFSMMGEAEFALVVAVFGVSEGLVPPDIYASIVWAILLSTLISPLLLRATLFFFPYTHADNDDVNDDANDSKQS